MGTQPSQYRGYRFPPEIISYAVWLYHRFCLSFRDVEELLAERGITVSYEALRQWCLKFGSSFTKKLRHRQGRLGDTWHLDEMFVTINGERHYLWRAVDQDGEVLDILVQKRRDQHAAKRFFRKLLKGLHYVPRLLVTDQLGSYGAARRELLPSVAHRQDRRLNNRAEVSHQPTRQRERQMKRFKSAGQAQRFLSAHGPINNLFCCGRHLMRAAHYRAFREQAFVTWREVAGFPQAA
ncbi:MAG TPA: IS6 family transposase [Candidatus Binatia bacterium]|nr:IS6 family transposase [Candidatus Binatia bacterium]